MSQAGGWRFWIDRGGTFTDVVVVRPDGTTAVQKLLSEAPGRYEDAALEAIRRAGADAIDSVEIGTTVATNALLERRGTPTVLVTTAGFADAVTIGDQTRPDIFALEIRRPSPLHAQTIEASERVSADGRILEPLDEGALLVELRRVRALGVESVAIAFLHGYRHPAHEARAAELAREAGFESVFASHEVSPTIRLVPRTDTTIVDAYLSPVLRRYVDRVGSALKGAGLLFMQSNGGLVRAERFRGKDSVLSGPAGGVVGAVEAARELGLDRVIGFDMGGTSTDVSHFAGEHERTFDCEIAGVRLRAPMLAVHTVAAGGGSILHYDGSRFRVGPDSAGADPGPRCYRRGGPLTITDCNVLLGRIQPDLFPAVFGPGGDEPLDAGAVAGGFEELAERTGMSPRLVAEGFLRVAVENMARAIQRVSVHRGHDVTEYALCAFGGAAGQHACMVADALQIRTILVHRHAGVLSAWGIGHAPRRSIRECPVQAPLSRTAIADCEAALESLQAAGGTRTERRLCVHFEGADLVLEVPFGSAQEVRAAFHQSHRRRFGYTFEERPLVVASATLETITESERPGIQAALPASPGVPLRDGVWSRDSLAAGQEVRGPALILDSTSTTVIDAGWAARVHHTGTLVIERVEARVRREGGTGVDPIRLTVFNHRFMGIAEQMGLALEQTARSVNIKERRDYSCALFDASGNLVANAPHIPVHLGSMGHSVKAVLRGHTPAPGDVFVLNDPYDGGTHLPDITVVMPVFTGDELTFFTAARGHHADVGGATPGSMPPNSTSIDQEGARIRPMRLVREGRFEDQAIRGALAGSRNVEENLADLQAQVAASARGAALLGALVDELGAPTVLAYMGHVRANAAESVRRVIDRLVPGSATCELDDGSRIRVEVTTDPAARTARVDFAGTSAQRPNGFNAPQAVVSAVVLYVVRALSGADIPLNAGCLEPLEIAIPAGSMLSPSPPAAVVAGNVETSQVIADALLAAVGAQAGSQGTMNNLTFGDVEHQYYETICGGSGAGPTFDGTPAVHTHMTNSRLTDPEVLETRHPVRVRELRIRPGSGGAGRHRGGDGAIRALIFERPMTVSILSNRRRIAPPGLDGGQPGAAGCNRLLRAGGATEDLGACATIEVRPGDTIVIETPGGGGYGADIP